MRKIFTWKGVFLLFLIIPSHFITAREFFLEPFGCFLDMPQGWEALEVTGTKATFSDTAQKGFLQLKAYPSDTWNSSLDIFQEIGNQLQADAEGDDFLFLGNDSAFSTLLFGVNDQPYQGFAFFINGADFDWVILSFAQMDVYEAYQFFLLSGLDSFALNENALLHPGPVSAYFLNSYPEEYYFQAEYVFEDKTFIMEMDGNAMETADVIVERETAVLSRYTPEDEDAWQRFYRVIYRDNYHRLDDLFRQFLFNGLSRETDPGETARRLLTWIQGFSYSRTGTAGDYLPPLSALYNMTGDCDSLGLLYVSLLKHYGIDSILMVSSRFSHALAGVDVPGTGARFPFLDKEYLIAETTDKVDLGLIAASMADPEGWLGISFN